jgi:hypothetical protein
LGFGKSFFFFFHFPIEPRRYPPFQDKCEDHNGWVQKNHLHFNNYLDIHHIFRNLPLTFASWLWGIPLMGNLNISGRTPYQRAKFPTTHDKPMQHHQKSHKPPRYIHSVQHTFYILKLSKTHILQSTLSESTFAIPHVLHLPRLRRFRPETRSRTPDRCSACGPTERRECRLE